VSGLAPRRGAKRPPADTAVGQAKTVDRFEAASQPSAGQACSLQRVGACTVVAKLASVVVVSGLAPRWGAKRPPSRHCGGSGKNSRPVLGPLRSPAQVKPAHHNGSGACTVVAKLASVVVVSGLAPRWGAKRPPSRHCGGSGKNSRPVLGPLRAQRKSSLPTTTGRGHAPSWLSLRV